MFSLLVMPQFSKRSRILKPKEFESLRKKSFSNGNSYFVIRWIPKPKRRLGIVISKKVAKAHKRNLIKRIIRECFRLNAEKFPLGDVIIIARQGLDDLKRRAIWEFLLDSLQKGSRAQSFTAK